MKKLLLSFTLLASTLGTGALALADDQPARDRVIDHRDGGDRRGEGGGERRDDRGDREVRQPTWSKLAQAKLATKRGSVVFKLNRAASDDDRLQLAINGGSARITGVTIQYVGGRKTSLRPDQLLSGTDVIALPMAARHGDIKSVTVTFAKAKGRNPMIQLQGIDLPARTGGGHR